MYFFFRINDPHVTGIDEVTLRLELNVLVMIGFSLTGPSGPAVGKHREKMGNNYSY